MGIIDENIAKQNLGWSIGSNLVSTGINLAMYEKQKRDAIDFWKMQNTYNTPTAQMERYKAAGLNPNLIYGKAGDNSASTIERPTGFNTNYVAPKNEFSKAENMLAIANVENAKKTNALLDQQIEKNKVEQALIAAQTENTMQDTEQRKFKLGFDTEIRPTSMEYQKESLRKLSIEADNIINKYNLEKIMQTANIYNIKSEIMLRTSQGKINAKTLEKLDQDIQAQTLDNQLRKAGLQPSDPAWSRILVRIFNLEDINSKTPDQIIKIIEKRIGDAGEAVGNKLLDILNPFK